MQSGFHSRPGVVGNIAAPCARIPTISHSYPTIPKECLNPTDADLASNDALDDWILRNGYTQHHIAGTCKMGPSSAQWLWSTSAGRCVGSRDCGWPGSSRLRFDRANVVVSARSND